MNTLWYGDNLTVLREEIASESVDLIYLDPPFNSKRDYNVLFAEHDTASEAQIKAFEDYWRWDKKAEETYTELTDPGAEARGVPGRVITLMESMRRFLGQADMMAYLVMMAVRLVELRRVLKETGSIYLHCDPTASHYLKLLMDAVFGPLCFLNEVTWKRTHSHGNVYRNFGSICDTLLVYTKTEEGYVWNQLYTPFTPEYVEETFKYRDPDGRRWQSVTLRNPGVRPNLHFPFKASNGVTYKPHPNGWSCDEERLRQYDREGRLHFPKKPTGALRLKMYLDESPGIKLQNLWDDIPALGSRAAERLGYPTQKPLTLLERIIGTSSNEGDLVLDPFCGCGTAVHAAQRLKRQWIGIDITHLAIGLIRNRLETAFPGIEYEVKGLPADAAGARELAETDPYGFQWWGLYLIGARPAGNGVKREGKKGKDRGVDGVIRFRDDPKATTSYRITVSVKAGKNLNPSMVRDLRGTMERDGAPIGVLLTMYEPTAEMRAEAAKAGKWKAPVWGRSYDRIQLIAVEQAFKGKRPEYPGVDVTLQAAPTDHPAATALPLPGMAAETATYRPGGGRRARARRAGAAPRARRRPRAPRPRRR